MPSLYSFAADDLLVTAQDISDVHQQVVLVGHNPAFEQLIARLCKLPQARCQTASASLLELEIDRWADLAPGCGQLSWQVVSSTAEVASDTPPIADEIDLAGTDALPQKPFARLRQHALAICAIAIQRLDDSAPPQHADVRALRVASKRLRACWQLLRPTRPKLARKRNTALRDAASALAGQRTGRVLHKTLARVQRASEDIATRDALATLASQLPHSAPSTTPRVDDALRVRLRDTFAEEAEHWRKLKKPKHPRRALRRGLLRSYQRARRQATLAAEQADAAHEWRKWVKYLRYQAQALGLPEAQAHTGELTKLGKLLGRRNDLFDLDQALRGLGKKRHRKLARLAIHHGEQRLMSKSERLRRSAFAQKAGRWSKQTLH
jgi:CHAD domain-containing protein